jgi:hypothetical protein
MENNFQIDFCTFFRGLVNDVISIETVRRRMVDELERICKESVMTESRYSAGIFLEELRTAGVPAGIRTEHFPNASLGRYP